MTYEIHEACLRMPDMDAAEYESLKESIGKHGLLEEIVLCEGRILDGRHRYRACLELEIEPRFRDWNRAADYPGAYVWAKASHRNLSQGRRAAIWMEKFQPEAAEFAERKAAIQEEANRKRSEAAKVQHAVSNPRVGESSGGNSLGGATRKNTNKSTIFNAEAAGVSSAMMGRAEYIKRHDAELLGQVAEGVVSLHQAVEKVQEKLAKQGRTRASRAVHEEGKPDLVEEIKRLANEGVVLKQISAYLGISRERIWKLSKQHQIEFPGAVAQKLQSININEFIESKSFRAAALAGGLEIVEDYIDQVDVTRIGEWVRLFKGSMGGLRKLVKTLEGLKK